MTLSDNAMICNTENQNPHRSLMDISAALKGALLQAHKQGRITAGAYDCAKQMQVFPDKVMFCILAVNDGNDDMVQMEHILLEAYCREQHIGVVKVDSSDKLGKLLINGNKKNKTLADFSCALVERPKENTLSGDELSFVDKYRKFVHSQTSQVVIEIPV